MRFREAPGHKLPVDGPSRSPLYHAMMLSPSRETQRRPVGILGGARWLITLAMLGAALGATAGGRELAGLARSKEAELPTTVSSSVFEGELGELGAPCAVGGDEGLSTLTSPSGRPLVDLVTAPAASPLSAARAPGSCVSEPKPTERVLLCRLLLLSRAPREACEEGVGATDEGRDPALAVPSSPSG